MNNNDTLNTIINKCNKKANSFSCGFLLESYTIINNKFIEVQGSIYQNASGKKISALFDIDGFELIPLSEKEDNNFFKVYEPFDNNLLIEYYKDGKTNNTINKLVHCKYDTKSKSLTEVNSFDNNQDSLEFYDKYGKDDKTTLVIKVYDKNKNILKKQLYSIKKGTFVSPKVDNFELLNETDEKLFFIFTDTVYSYDTYNGEKLSSLIKGAITNKGEMFNRVYVESENIEKVCELNGHENFMQYRSLKNHISRNLDIKIARLEEEQRKQEQTLKNYMVKVKKFYNN